MQVQLTPQTQYNLLKVYIENNLEGAKVDDLEHIGSDAYLTSIRHTFIDGRVGIVTVNFMTNMLLVEFALTQPENGLFFRMDWRQKESVNVEEYFTYLECLYTMWSKTHRIHKYHAELFG